MTLTRRAVLVALTALPIARPLGRRRPGGRYGSGYRVGGYR